MAIEDIYEELSRLTSKTYSKANLAREGEVFKYKKHVYNVELTGRGPKE